MAVKYQQEFRGVPEFPQAAVKECLGTDLATSRRQLVVHSLFGDAHVQFSRLYACGPQNNSRICKVSALLPTARRHPLVGCSSSSRVHSRTAV